ncbi:Transposon Ty3-G Gag-Pol poly [Paramuricea clavata]|uniref:Transposon Ty3-G Gag-Pol poly n=1 Tax=Paramuricea clavata TaxID=317549 RepID=A0A6S7KF04_PARCT|nr:Transposon Ty3-G Gag-Pol poly [Paramuricea clavata]
MQEEMFHIFHEPAHLGFKGTLKSMETKVFWPTLKKDIRQWCKACSACQRNKIGRHTRAPLVPLNVSCGRFETIHVDLVGPLQPIIENKNMLMTVIDNATGFFCAYPLSIKGDGSNAVACAKRLVEWITFFGVPKMVISDRGPQFISSLWEEVTKFLGIKKRNTSSYHPQCNGKIERLHRSIKNSLRSRLDGRQNWLHELPWVVLGLRNSPNGDTGISPAEAVFGTSEDYRNLAQSFCRVSSLFLVEMSPKLKKVNPEKLLRIKFDTIQDRLKTILAKANSSLGSISSPLASSYFSSILLLTNELTETFASWLKAATEADDDSLSEIKKSYNLTASECDLILIALKAVFNPKGEPVKTEDSTSPRLRKIDFRPFEKSNPKNWFEQLEVVFQSMKISEDSQRFATLLRLLDEQTGSLLSAITREKPVDAYIRSKKVLISEFSLTKFDRIKTFLVDSAPAHEENLSHFFSRIDVLFEDVSIDDVKKYTVLRHAPPAVRLHLAGDKFDEKEVADLVREADALTRRSQADAVLVGAVASSRGRGGKPNSKHGKVCSYHIKFGHDAYQCAGEDRCILWSKDLKKFRRNTKDQEKGNEPGQPSRG